MSERIAGLVTRRSQRMDLALRPHLLRSPDTRSFRRSPNQVRYEQGGFLAVRTEQCRGKRNTKNRTKRRALPA